MSITANLLQTASGVLPLARGVLSLSALAALLIFFKPLLTGIARALLLTFKPRLTKAQRDARSHMRNSQLFQRMINSSQEPSQAAELRAMAARA